MDRHTKKTRLTHHKLGPDEMQLRSANAIGDPAAGETKQTFLSADRCRVVVLPVGEAEMQCEAIPQWLLSSYGAKKRRCVTREF